MMSPSFTRLSAAILPLVTGLILMSCVSTTTLQTKIPTYPPHPLEPVPEKVVIANAVDVEAEDYRDKKTEEFHMLIDSAMKHAADEIVNRSQANALVVWKQVVPIHNRDSVDAFIRSAQATHGMFVTAYNAYFIQTHVEVTKTETGKDREAFYDLIVDVRYVLKSLQGLSLDTLITVQRFHSSRQVISGFLAAGPSIVSNKNAALKSTIDNVDLYLKSFFLGEEMRIRKMFFPKEFRSVHEAVRQYSYVRAFEESKKLMASPDKKISANAYHICAVLAERNEDFESARDFLQESLARENNREVREMFADYRYMPGMK